MLRMFKVFAQNAEDGREKYRREEHRCKQTIFKPKQMYIAWNY